jgi:hypothetical protein
MLHPQGIYLPISKTMNQAIGMYANRDLHAVIGCVRMERKRAHYFIFFSCDAFITHYNRLVLCVRLTYT